MHAWALLLSLATADPGFGGAPPTQEFEAPPDAPVDDDPEQAALRARLEGALRAPAEATADSGRKPTKLELDLEKAKLDPTLPLLAFRIEVARAEQELEELTARLVRPEVLQVAADQVAALHEMSDLIERIALARLVKCTRGIGKEVRVKNYRMTSGGPVPLSTAELLGQLPYGDPQGCERITLMDADTVRDVRRLFAVRAELKHRSFGYYEVGARKALEQEEATLAKALALQAMFATVLVSPLR